MTWPRARLENSRGGERLGAREHKSRAMNFPPCPAETGSSLGAWGQTATGGAEAAGIITPTNTNILSGYTPRRRPRQ